MDYSQIKHEIKIKHQEFSKQRLYNISSKKIKTTMVGALDLCEKALGFVWGHNEPHPSQQQAQMKELWDIVRRNILELGHKQMDNLKAELENYQIEYKGQSVELPIKGKRNEK